jgi:hypothetical protein
VDDDEMQRHLLDAKRALHRDWMLLGEMTDREIGFLAGLGEVPDPDTDGMEHP